jgi:cyclopropane fatty-acyl-phospholipid synthase-like methyltransferase
MGAQPGGFRFRRGQERVWLPAMPERLTSPATARNRAPILTVLQRILPADARVLELASGAGEHAIFFASAMPGLTWRPSDPDADARASIAAWIKASAVANVLAPVAIDVCDEDWGLAGPFDALVAINMAHISPWRATLGLMAGARALLREGGVLFTYGPYMRDGRHTAPSNQAFDASLKARDPRWGVRDVADVTSAARAQGLILRELVEMPANNLSLVFEKRRSIA